MAVTVNVQSNPKISVAGTSTADAVVVTSGFTNRTGDVVYQFERMDRTSSFSISSKALAATASRPQVISISSTSLTIILPFRTKFRVRASQRNGAWTSWVEFKTRDKRYQSPDAIRQLSDDSDSTAWRRGNRQIIVANSAKATEQVMHYGARIVNTDTGWVGTTSITPRYNGVRVINS